MSFYICDGEYNIRMVADAVNNGVRKGPTSYFKGYVGMAREKGLLQKGRTWTEPDGSHRTDITATSDLQPPPDGTLSARVRVHSSVWICTISSKCNCIYALFLANVTVFMHYF